MSSGMHRWLYEADRKKTANFKANLRAFLGRYVKGELVDNKDYMKSWQDDIFEFRFQLLPKRERLRMFGAFIKPDVFVAFNRKFRSEFSTQDDWDRVITRTIRECEKFFPGTLRMPSKPFSNCVTFKFVDLESDGAST